MASNISSENKQFIEHELETGTYGSRDELLDQAVCLLKRRRQFELDIQAGMDSGPSIPAVDVFSRLEEKARQLAAP